MEAEEERCSWCGTDPDQIAVELNRLQIRIEDARNGMSENSRLRCLDHLYEVRLLLKERGTVVKGPWALRPFQEGS